MDVQLVVRGRETEFPEKDGRHVIAKMLSGVNDTGSRTGMPGQGLLEQGKFDELWTIADNMRDSHVFGYSTGMKNIHKRPKINQLPEKNVIFTLISQIYFEYFLDRFP
jgi:hypothetical protein